MIFNVDKPIYRQISELIEQKILSGEWPEGERIPAVREIAMQVQVNPNTVMRAYEGLQMAGTIFNKRGIGYFVAEGARQKIADIKREMFIEYDLPEIFSKMGMIGLTPQDLAKAYKKFLKQQK